MRKFLMQNPSQGRTFYSLRFVCAVCGPVVLSPALQSNWRYSTVFRLFANVCTMKNTDYHRHLQLAIGVEGRNSCLLFGLRDNKKHLPSITLMCFLITGLTSTDTESWWMVNVFRQCFPIQRNSCCELCTWWETFLFMKINIFLHEKKYLFSWKEIRDSAVKLFSW